MTLPGGISLVVLAGCYRVPVRGAMPRIQNEDPAIDPVPIVLSSNENPLGPCPSAIEAGSKAVADLSHRYAREERERLLIDLAVYYGLNPD